MGAAGAKRALACKEPVYFVGPSLSSTPGFLQDGNHSRSNIVVWKGAMFLIEHLKPVAESDHVQTTCPVLGCKVKRPTQVKQFLAKPEFQCPEHRIFFSRSTFEYEDVHENLLWKDADDLAVLDGLKELKRESRIARERSEDAVTWNVLRHLERSGRLSAWVAGVVDSPVTSAVAHYWSADRRSGEVWSPLAQARLAFGELPRRETEPDLVIETPEWDVWVEAKVGASNSTTPSDPVGAQARYTEGAVGWCHEVCRSSFNEIAVLGARYELLRHWLLGSWAAAKRGKRFCLVNLVREGSETDIDGFVRTHFRSTANRVFKRASWESIRAYLERLADASANDELLIRFLREKSLGYDNRGRLVAAFAR